jgi:acetyl esterase/lipase
VRWLHLHAGELGVDPSHIFVLGDPAGAQIALYIAAVGHTVGGDDAAALPCVSSSNRSQLGHNVAAQKLLFGSDGQTRPVDQGRAASPLFISARNGRR